MTAKHAAPRMTAVTVVVAVTAMIVKAAVIVKTAVTTVMAVRAAQRVMAVSYQWCQWCPRVQCKSYQCSQ